MLDTLGIVEVRRGSALPETKLSRRLGGKSLLEWVVRRVTECQRLDALVVCLADTPEDRDLAALVPPDVDVYLGRENDALARVVRTLDRHPAKAVVHVFADNPFIDPVLIDRLVSTADAHPECDYISYCSSSGQPTILSPLAVFAEWCSASALRRADREAKRAAERELVTAPIYAHPETYRTRLVRIPAEMDRHDLRLKLECEEDWEHAQVIYDALGSEEWDWQRIAGLLDGQPALRKRMAVLNRHSTGA